MNKSLKIYENRLIAHMQTSTGRFEWTGELPASIVVRRRLAIPIYRLTRSLNRAKYDNGPGGHYQPGSVIRFVQIESS